MMKSLEILTQEQSVENILTDFLQQQLQTWQLANTNYMALKNVKERKFSFDGFELRVQFNPARITSTKAKVDSNSIQKRACFLCEKNRPEEQKQLSYGKNFYVLVNPFPIIHQHFTLVKRQHQNQMLLTNLEDMLGMAKIMQGYTLFYNGAKCGASAPDHMHFQAGSTGFMPIDSEYERLKNTHTNLLFAKGNVEIRKMNNYLRQQITVESDCQADIIDAVRLVYLHFAAMQPLEQEPMLNVIANYWNGKYTVHLFPRRLHRPTQYFEKGEKQLLISPGAVDFGGVFSTPRQEDFEKVTAADLIDIFQQICLDAADFNKLCKNIEQEQ